MSLTSMDGFLSMPVKFSDTSTAVRYLFCKTHKVREPTTEKPNNLTLFVVNVPSYCDKECITRLFSEFGRVKRVYFHKEPTSSATPSDKYTYFSSAPSIKGTKVAYVVFDLESSVQAVLDCSLKKPRFLSTKKYPIVTGLQKWCDDYNSSIPKESDMETEITDFMTEYDQAVTRKVEEEKNKTGVQDDEGWTKVTKYGKTPGIARTEANKIKVEISENKKRKKKELQNFYTFQVKESKMEHIAQLREKFEEDKNRIELMKASRKFRPY